MNIELWFQIFGVISLISIVSIISYFFTSIGKNVTNLRVLKKTPKVQDQEFLANITAAAGGNVLYFNVHDYELISENEIFFKRLLEDITNAKESISIVTYVWEYDTISSKFFDALKAAVMRGVEVNLLIDSFGSSIDKKIIKELEDLGIHIQIFRPFKIGKVSLYAGRAHRRAFIFDSRLGYFGGSSISKKWFTKRRKDQVVYDDIMYRVTGEAVAHLESSFGELWSSYSGIILQGKRITREVDSSKSINAFSLSHIPRMDIHPITYTFWYACMCARAEIVIINPYFIPGTTLLNILCQKAKSGVRVQVITQGTSEMFFVQGACHSYYETLLACGVEIYEHTKPHLHTKMLVIDKHFTIGGSSNFDIRSQRINHELVFGVQSDTFASDNLEVLKIYQPFLKKINVDVWRKRPYIHKLFENSMHYLSEQF